MTDYDHIGDPEDYQERAEQTWAQEVEDDREALAQLRAAVEALCDRWEKTEGDAMSITAVRAVLADNGAAALREVKADVWSEGVDAIYKARLRPPALPRNPYREEL